MAVSVMAVSDIANADEARRDFRSARSEARGFLTRKGVDFGAFAEAYAALHASWLRWEVAAKAIGVDPLDEAPEWRSTEAPRLTIQRVPDDACCTWSDLRHEGWVTVEHEAVPDSIRSALLGILGWGEDQGGGVFARHRDDGVYRFALVTWVADGRGGVRQEIAMQVPVCTHDVPLIEGCTVCGGEA